MIVAVEVIHNMFFSYQDFSLAISHVANLPGLDKVVHARFIEPEDLGNLLDGVKFFSIFDCWLGLLFVHLILISYIR
jgi:hypothetical protein